MICLRKSIRSLRQADQTRILPAEKIPQADFAYLSGKPRQNRLPAEPATGLYPWKAAGCGCPTRRPPYDTGPNTTRANRTHRHHGRVTSTTDDPRDQIAHALQANTPASETSILVGWVTVAEYITTDGQRYLAAEYGQAPGTEHETTSWQRRGYLHEALTNGLIDDPVIVELYDHDEDDEDDQDEDDEDGTEAAA